MDDKSCMGSQDEIISLQQPEIKSYIEIDISHILESIFEPVEIFPNIHAEEINETEFFKKTPT